jgi:prepilin-type N-terminal cleavage/methylation domain-containing protein
MQFRSTHGRLIARRRQRRAFSLVEMVMVITIIGMISSMAVPRISKGTTSVNDASLAGNLVIIRKAINFYAAEHNGDFPGPSAARFVGNMTAYTDAAGNLSPSRTPLFAYGPYLLRIPPCPIGENAGDDRVLIDAVNSPPKANPGSGRGWLYNPISGEFYANTGSRPQAGTTLESHAAAIDAGLN